MYGTQALAVASMAGRPAEWPVIGRSVAGCPAEWPVIGCSVSKGHISDSPGYLCTCCLLRCTVFGLKSQQKLNQSRWSRGYSQAMAKAVWSMPLTINVVLCRWLVIDCGDGNSTLEAAERQKQPAGVFDLGALHSGVVDRVGLDFLGIIYFTLVIGSGIQLPVLEYRSIDWSLSLVGRTGAFQSWLSLPEHGCEASWSTALLAKLHMSLTLHRIDTSCQLLQMRWEKTRVYTYKRRHTLLRNFESVIPWRRLTGDLWTLLRLCCACWLWGCAWGSGGNANSVIHKFV